MHTLNTLSLFMLPSVPSSYSNMWWAQSLKQSIHVNKSFGLKVLTEEHMSVDTALTRNNRYINYPVFNTKVEPGFYHINISGSNYLFTGFINIADDKNVFWWGTDATDRVFAGFAGDPDLMENFREGYAGEIIDWLGSFTYSDSYPRDKDIYHILKPF